MAVVREQGSKTVDKTTSIPPEIYREMGLSDVEYAKVAEALGRHPTYTEVGMYAVMWSEHCGYKYSRPVLRLFRKYREALEGGGLENAGVIDIGDGYGIVMKMETHNHPSAVEPFQGAATGVGGILRDIFTMGARPIACLNSLRFGSLDDPHNRYLFENVVAGIAFYGNCVGVPTVAGEVVFEDCYSGNCLVNAMSAGIVKIDEVASACASGVGNSVMYVGSRTGCDGIHGATFASVELGPDSESRRPNVQIGDPFTEKLLIEATLEALKTGYVIGIQDMGAAGITCSTCETAAKAGTGMEIDVLKVPRREEGMTPYEIMLSESQERMLAVVRKGKEDEVAAVFKKWGLNAVVIGHVTADGLVRVWEGDHLVAEVPAKSLADDAPTYYLEIEEPEYLKEVQSFDASKLPEPDDYNEALERLLDSPSIASKEWVYRQYDHMVQTNTVVLPGSDAAALRIRGTGKAIALVTDCNGRYCYLDPFAGAQIAVAEAARNLACTGARALGVTDCVSFGNPEKPQVFWQFKRAIEGLAEACEFFGTPVVSGNVSFYNETPDTAIYPTPVIGMLGLIDNVENRCTMEFEREGDVVALLTGRKAQADSDPETGICGADDIGGSEYLKVMHGVVAGRPPALDMDAEKRLHACLVDAVSAGQLSSAHDCSDGGLAVALAESSIAGGLGAEVGIVADCGASVALFGEAQSRAVVSLSADHLGELRELVDEHGIECTILGKVHGDRLKISVNGVTVIDRAVEHIGKIWKNAIPGRMESRV
ncbi:MAG: phosphoribosylformylglycinamidine synthase subunit PurL [Armatimonadetes bacterium]|nr:phosphoribosylformylglycinamidine synthase subunit PurL [Armatimonadota bacterium]